MIGRTANKMVLATLYLPKVASATINTPAKILKALTQPSSILLHP